MRSRSFLGSSYTFLDVQTSDPPQNATVFVQGDTSGVVSAGETVYMTAVLHRVTILGPPFSYGEVPTPQDIHPSLPVDLGFVGVAVVGVVVAAVGALRTPGRAPQG